MDEKHVAIEFWQISSAYSWQSQSLNWVAKLYLLFIKLIWPKFLKKNTHLLSQNVKTSQDTKASSWGWTEVVLDNIDPIREVQLKCPV